MPDGARRALARVALVLALAGLAISAYLTVVHYSSSVTLACTDSGVVNCAKVTTSPQSHLASIPVPVLGLAYFAAMALLDLPAAWRAEQSVLGLARLALAAGGVAFVFYLVYTELFTLDAICLWCTAVHVITVTLFATVAIGTALATGRDPEPPPARADAPPPGYV